MSPPPEPLPEAVLRVATWNIHDARGQDGVRDLDRVAEMLGQLQAPLVGLQEVRCGSSACDAAYLARQHGYHWHAIETWRHDGAQYGNALLTTFPIESTRVHDLSVGRREPRAALEAHIPWQGQRLRVVVTHLGLRAGERRKQVERLLTRLAPDDGTLTILLGDINEWWLWGRTLRWLHRRFGASPSLRTYPARWPLFALDRVWVSPPWVVSAVSSLQAPAARTISDHLPVVATLRLRGTAPLRVGTDRTGSGGPDRGEAMVANTRKKAASADDNLVGGRRGDVSIALHPRTVTSHSPDGAGHPLFTLA